jgi:hypothetical protein
MTVLDTLLLRERCCGCLQSRAQTLIGCSDVLVIAFFLVIVIVSFYQIFTVIIYSYSSLPATYLQKSNIFPKAVGYSG